MKVTAVLQKPPQEIVSKRYTIADFLKETYARMCKQNIPCIEYTMEEGENIKVKQGSYSRAARQHSIPIQINARGDKLYITRVA